MVNQFYHTVLNSPIAPCYPAMAVIEPTNLCNQACDYCPTGMGMLKRPQGIMAFGQFRRIIDQIGPYLAYIELYNMGEPLLNKEIYSMISYAKSKYSAYIKVDTNGMVLDPKKLIESGLDEIWFQIGGITQDTHTIYRSNGDIGQVFENMRMLLEERKKHPYSKLKIKAGMIIMKHNEHEIEDFLNLKKTLGINEAMLIKPTVKDVEQGRRFLPSDPSFWVYDRESFEGGKLVRKGAHPEKCPISWNSVFVAWNGDVHPCIKDNNNEYKLGNMLQEDFKSIWNGQKAKYFRRSKVSRERLKMCAMCPGYGAMPWFNHYYINCNH